MTADLLAETGYKYLLDWCMDDQPVWFRCRASSASSPCLIPRSMKELSAEGPLVMGVALHAYIVGQPHRLRHLKRALRHIAQQREAVWLTTPGAIARHCIGLPAGTVP